MRAKGGYKCQAPYLKGYLSLTQPYFGDLTSSRCHLRKLTIAPQLKAGRKAMKPQKVLLV